MTRLLLLLFLSPLLFGCADKTPGAADGPSPLLASDSDRLWILARMSRVGDGRECQDHYLVPDDPRYQGLAQKCEFWARNYADYLALNGFPTIEYQHLEDPVYWQWFVSTHANILTCKSTHKSPPVGTPRDERNSLRERRNACDPYDDALQNRGLAPTDFGIRYN